MLPLTDARPLSLGLSITPSMALTTCFVNAPNRGLIIDTVIELQREKQDDAYGPRRQRVEAVEVE
jgi:hypothetical protein